MAAVASAVKLPAADVLKNDLLAMNPQSVADVGDDKSGRSIGEEIIDKISPVLGGCVVDPKTLPGIVADRFKKLDLPRLNGLKPETITLTYVNPLVTQISQKYFPAAKK